MYEYGNRSGRTIKLTTAVGIGMTTFVIGLLLGATMAENNYNRRIPPESSPATGQLFSTIYGDLKPDELKDSTPRQPTGEPRTRMD